MAVKQCRVGANAQRGPSARDQQIFVEVQALGRLQSEVARQHGLTQSRVSQILKRVGRWRGNVDPEQVGEPSPSEQARLDQWLERRTLEEVRAYAFRQFRRAAGEEEGAESRGVGDLRSGSGAGSGDPRPTHDLRSGSGAESEDPRSAQAQPPSGRAQGACVQWLKLVLKTVEMQWDLADRPRAKSRLEEEDPIWYLLRDQMQSARRHAEQEKRLPKCGNVSALVEQAMAVLYSPEIQLSPLDGSGKRPPGAKLAPCETLTSEEREARRRVAAGGDLRSERGSGSGDPRPTRGGEGASGAHSANISAADSSAANGESAAGTSDVTHDAAATCAREAELPSAPSPAAEGLQKNENISAPAEPARFEPATAEPSSAVPHYAPPADYGYQKPIEDDAWREYMAERRREHLQALVIKVIER